jgi:hypothetical protein
MATCAQKNLARVRRLLSMLNGDYYNNGFNEFVSTKATPEQRWDKLEDHINFYSAKKYFFVAGEGLSTVNKSKVLSEIVTHQGKISNLRDLLTANKIFAFIQHSRQGGCKIICQHDDPTISPLKPKAATTHPRTWFITNIIGQDTTDSLDWTTKKFEPRWSFERGINNAITKETPKAPSTIGKNWSSNWKMQREEKSVVSRLSSTGDSIETIRSQLTAQQQENTRLIEENKKIKEESQREAESLKDQIEDIGNKWKVHVDTETAVWSERLATERASMETATNQKLKVYESMNELLRRENEKMKSRVDFQEQQQQRMQQQIVELLARPTFPTHQHLQDQTMDYDHKRDTPTTPTTMTDSPERAQRKKANNMAPLNLMESLIKQKPTHQTPTRSRSLTAINETAQGITKHSPGRTTTTSTSYAKETTGGNKK